MGRAAEPIKDIDTIYRIEELLGERDGLIWAIGTQIGLRVSDIVKLNIDIVGRDDYFLREKKTGKCKKFPINEELKSKIQNYYDNYRKNIVAKNKRDEYALFLTRKHMRISQVTFYRDLVNVCISLGVNSHVGTHTMRKTFGYHHYKQFKDVALLQKIFNHSTPTVTLRYIGIEQEQINTSYKQFKYKEEEPEISQVEKSIRFILQDYFRPTKVINNTKYIDNDKLYKEVMELNYRLNKLNDNTIKRLQLDTNKVQKLCDKQNQIDIKLDMILKILKPWRTI